MANGTRHKQVSIALSFVSFGITAYITNSQYYAILAGMGTIAGIPLTPDLDIIKTVDKEGKRKRSKSPLLWRWYWFPYADVIKHRSWASHFPVIGTFIRVLYMLIPVMVIAPSVGSKIGQLEAFVFMSGLIVSDTAHWILDGMPIK